MTHMPDVPNICPANRGQATYLVRAAPNSKVASAGQNTQMTTSGPTFLCKGQTAIPLQKLSYPGSLVQASSMAVPFSSRGASGPRMQAPASLSLPRQIYKEQRATTGKTVTILKATDCFLSKSSAQGPQLIVRPEGTKPGMARWLANMTLPQGELNCPQLVEVPVSGRPENQVCVLVPVPPCFETSKVDIDYSPTITGTTCFTTAISFTPIACPSSAASTSTRSASSFCVAPSIAGDSSSTAVASTCSAVNPFLTPLPTSSTPAPTHETATTTAAAFSSVAASSATIASATAPTFFTSATSSSTSKTRASNVRVSSLTRDSASTTATCSSTLANSSDEGKVQSSQLPSSIVRAASSTVQSSISPSPPSLASSSPLDSPSSLHPPCCAKRYTIKGRGTMHEDTEDDGDAADEEPCGERLLQSRCTEKSMSQMQIEVCLEGDEMETCEEDLSQNEGTSPSTLAMETDDSSEKDIETESCREGLAQNANRGRFNSTAQSSDVAIVFREKKLPQSVHRRKSFPVKSVAGKILMTALGGGDGSRNDRATNFECEVVRLSPARESSTSLGDKNQPASQRVSDKVDQGAVQKIKSPEPCQKEVGTSSHKGGGDKRGRSAESSSDEEDVCWGDEISTCQGSGGDGRGKKAEIFPTTKADAFKGSSTQPRQDSGSEGRRSAETSPSETDDSSAPSSHSDTGDDSWTVLKRGPPESPPAGFKAPLVIILRREQKKATKRGKCFRRMRVEAKKRKHGRGVVSKDSRKACDDSKITNSPVEEHGTGHHHDRVGFSLSVNMTNQDRDESERARTGSKDGDAPKASMPECSESTQNRGRNVDDLMADELSSDSARHIVNDNPAVDSVALDNQTRKIPECNLVITNVIGSFQDEWLDSFNKSDRLAKVPGDIGDAAEVQNDVATAAIHPSEDGQYPASLSMTNSCHAASLTATSKEKEKDNARTPALLKTRPSLTCLATKTQDAVKGKQAGVVIKQVKAQQREKDGALLAVDSGAMQGKLMTDVHSLVPPVAPLCPASKTPRKSSSVTQRPADWKMCGACKRRKLHKGASVSPTSVDSSVIAATQSSRVDHSLHCQTTGHYSDAIVGSDRQTAVTLSLRSYCDTPSLTANGMGKEKSNADITECRGNHQPPDQPVLSSPPATEALCAEKEREAGASTKQGTARQREKGEALQAVNSGPIQGELITGMLTQDPPIAFQSAARGTARRTQSPADWEMRAGGKRRKHCENASVTPTSSDSPDFVIQSPREEHGLDDAAEIASLRFHEQVERWVFPRVSQEIEKEPHQWDPNRDEEMDLLGFKQSLLAERKQMEQVLLEVDAKLRVIERETEQQEGVPETPEGGQQEQEHLLNLFGQENGWGKEREERNENDPARGSGILGCMKITFSLSLPNDNSSVSLSGPRTDPLSLVDISESLHPVYEEKKTNVQDEFSELPTSSRNPDSYGISGSMTYSDHVETSETETKPSMKLPENMTQTRHTLRDATRRNPWSEFPPSSAVLATQQAPLYSASGEGEIYPSHFALFSVPGLSGTMPNQCDTADDNSILTETYQGSILQPSLSFDDLWDNRVIQTGVSDEEWSPSSDENKDLKDDPATAAPVSSATRLASWSSHSLKTEWERLEDDYLDVSGSSRNHSSWETAQGWRSMWKRTSPFWMTSGVSLSKVNEGWMDYCEDLGCTVTNTWVNRKSSWKSTSPEKAAFPTMHSAQRQPFPRPGSSSHQMVSVGGPSSSENLTSSALRQICKKRKSSDTAPRIESRESTSGIASPEKWPCREVARSAERFGLATESRVQNRNQCKVKSPLQSRHRSWGNVCAQKNLPAPLDVISVDDDSSEEELTI